MESRAVYCSHDSIDGILPTLAIVFDSPDIRTVTDTPFILQQLGFIAVKSEKYQRPFLMSRPRWHKMISPSIKWRGLKKKTTAPCC